VKVAQHVEPARAGHHAHRDGGQRRKRRGPSKKGKLGLALAPVLAAWAAVGVYGASVYGHDYYTFRGFPPPRTPKGIPAGKLVRQSFFSPALRHERSYLIYLPAGYSGTGAHRRRYPVFYFLHGSPGWASLVFNAARIGVDFDVLLHRHRIRPFLMVMPDGGDGTFAGDTEWADTRDGRYDTFVMNVVHAVDRRWPTIRRRQDRLIAGNSEGAYAALNLSLRHIRKFALAESWSGYVHPEPKAKPFKGEPPSVVAANDPSVYLPRVAREVRRLGLRAYIYTGTKDHSARQVAAYAHELRAAGGRVVFKVFRGGHDWLVWREHAPRMLVWASHAFGRKP